MADWIDVGKVDDGWQDVGRVDDHTFRDTMKQAGKDAIGGVDAAVNMAAQIPSFIWSGIAGLGELSRTHGDIDRAVDSMRQVQQNNFGFGAPKPFTKEGQEALDMVGTGAQAAIDAVGKGGYTLGGEPGRALAEGTADTALNFLPLPGGKGVRALGKGIERIIKPDEGPKSPAAEAFDKAAAATKPADGWQDVGPVQGELDLQGAKTVSPYEAHPQMPFTAPDENGIPYRADLSMDVQKEQNGGAGKRDFFDDHPGLNDELQRTVQDQTQNRLDQRQANMEFEVKKQAGLDFNAAERARQEAAPVPGLEEERQRVAQAAQEQATRLENLHKQQAISDQQFSDAMDALNHKVAELDAQWKVDDRQRELEWQVKSQTALDQMRDIRQRDIKSDGPIGRQRGAVDPRIFESDKTKPDEPFRLHPLLSGTKIVDEAGKPVRVYHGTTADFPNYKPQGDGIFFTDSAPMASRYADGAGGNVRPVYLNIKNPAPFEAQKAAGFSRKKLEAQGYDGYVEQMEGRKVYVAFRDDQAVNALHVGDGTVRSGYVPLKQRGAVGDLSKQPRDLEKNEQQRAMAAHFGKNFDLDEWDVIKTKEEALALAKDAKDIVKDIGQKSLGSGINAQTVFSNNPILKFARTVFRDVRTLKDGLSRKYLTDDDVGLSHIWPKLNGKQRIALMDGLMEADKRQQPLTDSIMDDLGFNDKMKQFVKTFQEADGTLLSMQNINAKHLGMEPTDRRSGHFPGIFIGSYKTIVAIPKTDAKGNRVLKDGNPVYTTASVLTADTSAQHKLALQYAKEKFPDAKFLTQDRGGLAGVTNRYYSDIFSGWNQVLNFLDRKDPRFAEVTDIVQAATTKANNRLFNFNVHELAKKGVTGNEGNKPWLSQAENANDAFKALIQYFEQGFEHHALQIPLKEMRDVATAPETDHMPNTRKYLDAYVKKVTGDDLNDVGRALNTIIDVPFKYLMPNVSWDKNGNVKFGVGVGPSVPLKVAGVVKNNMAQLYMGWLNYMFTLSQWAQPLQTATPFLQTLGSRVGAGPHEVLTSLTKGSYDFMLAFAEHASGRTMEGLDPTARAAFKYALDRGMLQFSEIEQAHLGTQGAVARTKNNLAEANMKIGEQATRTPVFMAMVHLQVSHGMPLERALERAENATQFSMVDYHQWERPMVYSKLGVVGGFASGLTTFKHSLVSQGVYLGKQAVAPVGGASRSSALLPLAYATAAMLAFNGITGMPFYDEADTAYRMLTNHLFGEEKSIRETVLANNKEWINSGAISAATNLNLQSKFSSSDMIPDYDHPLRAFSPYAEGAWNIAKGAYDVAKNNADPQSVRNLASAASPAGWRGVPEDYLSKDSRGNLMGKNGLPAIYRTPDEWETRKYTGVRSQREALERTQTWDERQKQQADTDRRKDISTEYERRLVNNTMDAEHQDALQKEYVQRHGDIRQLLELWQKAALEKQQTEKQRLEGMPNGLSGVYRWQYYNK